MQLLALGSSSTWGVIYMLLLVFVAGWLSANLGLAVIYEQGTHSRAPTQD